MDDSRLPGRTRNAPGIRPQSRRIEFIGAHGEGLCEVFCGLVAQRGDGGAASKNQRDPERSSPTEASTKNEKVDMKLGEWIADKLKMM